MKILKNLIILVFISLLFLHIFNILKFVLLAFNAINIPSLGFEENIYSCLFHVTLISQLMYCFISLIGLFTLIYLINNKKYNNSVGLKLNIKKIKYKLFYFFIHLGGSLLIFMVISLLIFMLNSFSADIVYLIFSKENFNIQFFDNSLILERNLYFLLLKKKTWKIKYILKFSFLFVLVILIGYYFITKSFTIIFSYITLTFFNIIIVNILLFILTIILYYIIFLFLPFNFKFVLTTIFINLTINIDSFEGLNWKANKFLIFLLRYKQDFIKQDLFLHEISTDKEHRCFIFKFYNINLLSYEFLYSAIYSSLMRNDDFLKFGDSKIVISFAKETNGREFTLHDNILWQNDLFLKTYLELCWKNIIYLAETNYLDAELFYINVKVWDVSLYKNQNIKIPNYLKFKKEGVTKSSEKVIRKYFKFPSRSFHTQSFLLKNKQNRDDFTPLKPINQSILFNNKKDIITMDIETMNFNKVEVVNKDGIKKSKKLQTPVLITCAYYQSDNLKSFYTLINVKLTHNIELALLDLWTRFFKTLKTKVTWQATCFMHNLGSFDGYFLYKALLKINNDNLKFTESIIDKDHKFIQIYFNNKKESDLTWKDSLRIFPVKLDKLSKTFHLEGKLMKYDKEFNDPSIFNNEDKLNLFIKYGEQDSKALLLALKEAQNLYIDKYSVDIASIWSTSTLSLKIFRQSFLDCVVPSLTNNYDYFVRKGYYGGATDHYYMKAENVYYYDVNSLYPQAMCKPMPYEPLDFIINMKNISLDDFFGFCYVKVESPTDIKIPLLPYKTELGQIIFPTGKWFGTYFSEELKAVIPYGYKITLIQGLRFSKKCIFNNYVNHFYDIKKNSFGTERFIAKMQLNQLYGYFGRSRELIVTKNVLNKDLPLILTTHCVKSIVKINEKVSLVLISGNLNHDIIKKLNLKIDFIPGSGSPLIKNINKTLKSNVALSAAVTAYGRIEMLKYKTLPGYEIFYTDTDSIFTNKPLPEHLIGDDLGLMKDELVELNTNKIERALFLGNKKYAFQYRNMKGELNTISVFSGVKRNFLTWEQFNQMASCETLEIILDDVFTHSFSDLDISLNQRIIKIKKSDNKKLVNNKYLAREIYTSDFSKIFNENIIMKLYRKFKYFYFKYF